MSDPLSEHILRTAVEHPDDSNPLNVLNRIHAYEAMAYRAKRDGDTNRFIVLNEEANSLRDLYRRQVKAGVKGWKFWKDLEEGKSLKGSSPPGKAAHERTLEEFVGKDISVRDEYARWNEEAFILHGPHRLGPLKTVVSNFFQTEPRDVYWGSISGIKKIRESFSIAVPKSRPKHAILMADTYDVETGELLMTDNPVGEFYRDGLGINILGILEAYRGKGVAPYFVAAAIEATGNVEPSGAYSPLGLRTRVRAHRILVERALERGDHVPKKVREEYPDLA